MIDIKQRKERCGASSLPEFTLCGDAYDIGSDEPDLGNPRFANPGQSITCERCIEVLNHYLNAYKYSYRKGEVKWTAIRSPAPASSD